VSERHLHRELVAAVRTGPLALARTRRVQTARLLLDETSLPVTEVAFAAGFASLRQFNETVQAAFGSSPTELRQRARPVLESSGRLTLRLRHRRPLAGGPLLDFFSRRTLPAVEEVTATRYRRAVSLDNTTGIMELEPVPDADHVLLRLQLDTLSDLGPLVQRCRRLFDLDAAPNAIAAILGADHALVPLLAAHPGLRVPGAFDGWELAARTVLGQQVSVTGARTLAGRLVAALGESLPVPEGGITHRFPTPQTVAAADLTGLGLTRSRAAALRALACGVAEGEITLDHGAEWEHTEQALLALPGVGPWTVACIRLRALGDPDAFPSGDLGVRRAMEELGLPTNARDIVARAEAWRPWRAYAAMYLWESLKQAKPEDRR
jgi:AraC family transcriptional regulator of adaptative response / DNA-3-methyladenine glycosylase II